MYVYIYTYVYTCVLVYMYTCMYGGPCRLRYCRPTKPGERLVVPSSRS